MYPTWSNTISLKERIADSVEYKGESGIYVLSTSNMPLNRAMGVDTSGILYIGKSSNLKSRISALKTSNHNATWFLFQNRSLARFYINSEIKDDDKKMSHHVGELNITLAKSTPEFSESILETIALFTYVNNFGETPPLNSALPRRWEHEMNPDDVEWFNKKFNHA